MEILNVEQGTKEWRDARLCAVTGTRMDSVMGTSLDRVKLVAELIAEEATEQSKVDRPTPEMERGQAEEAFAIKLFEEQTGKKIEKQGLWVSDEFPWLRLSPDGPIPNKKGVVTEAVEVKNPDSKNAMFYRLTNIVPLEELELGTWVKPTKTDLREDPTLVPTFKPSSKAPFLGIPADYKWQAVLYYIVNTDLETLYFAIHDARFIEQQAKLYVVKINRTDPELQKAMAEAREELIRFREDWLKWKGALIEITF